MSLFAAAVVYLYFHYGNYFEEDNADKDTCCASTYQDDDRSQGQLSDFDDDCDFIFGEDLGPLLDTNESSDEEDEMD